MVRYEIDSKPGTIEFECGKDYTKRTVQNCKNLLMCHKGEIPFDRLRGFDMAMMDLTQEEMRENLLQELDRVMLWEPDADVVSAWTTVEDGETIIHCIVEIRE